LTALVLPDLQPGWAELAERTLKRILFTVNDWPDLAAQGRGGPSCPSDFNAYLKIAEDGKVTVYSGKIEMGQGIMTSLAQE
jgi:nicotinate dehydrogenase subunit B